MHGTPPTHPDDQHARRLKYGVWHKVDSYHFRHLGVSADGTTSPSGRTICYVGGGWELWDKAGERAVRITGGLESAAKARAVHDARLDILGEWRAK